MAQFGYSYNELGLALNKRSTGHKSQMHLENRENRLKERMGKLTGEAERLKVSGASESVREAHRILWYVEGIVGQDICVDIMDELLAKFRKLDLLPTHYHYPEIYRV